jgi:hypothetical protein
MFNSEDVKYLELTGPINLTNMATSESLCHIFHTELMVLLRMFDVLYYLSLYFCQTTYSNWRFLNLIRELS